MYENDATSKQKPRQVRYIHGIYIYIYTHVYVHKYILIYDSNDICIQKTHHTQEEATTCIYRYRHMYCTYPYTLIYILTYTYPQIHIPTYSFNTDMAVVCVLHVCLWNPHSSRVHPKIASPSWRQTLCMHMIQPRDCTLAHMHSQDVCIDTQDEMLFKHAISYKRPRAPTTSQTYKI